MWYSNHPDFEFHRAGSEFSLPVFVLLQSKKPTQAEISCFSTRHARCQPRITKLILCGFIFVEDFMLTKLILQSVSAVVLFVMISVASLAHAQEPDRVPSGDLKDFFRPPGVKKGGVSSTTRSIGSDTKTKPPEPAKKAVKPETKANAEPAPPAAPKPPEVKKTAKKPPAKSSNTLGRVKIETKETEVIEGGITFGEPSVTNWRVGVVLVAGSTQVRDVYCRIPVPVQWPEQTVSVFLEELPTAIADVTWENLGNIRFLKFRITGVAAGERLIGLVTFQVSTSQIIAPANTSIFRIPKKRTRDIKSYFSDSPGINLRDTKVKKQAKALFANVQSDWTKIEALFDWVRDNIEERAGDAKGSSDTFSDKFGNVEDRVGLFVAMCRINKVPARVVYVDGSQYAEFYLIDDKGKGHWFPCNISGIREFGSIGEPRVVLQKGDNYRVKGEKKKLRFVPAKATVKGTRPKAVQFVREPLSVK